MRAAPLQTALVALCIGPAIPVTAEAQATTPTIQEDLQLLFSDSGRETGEAFIRLLDRGPAAAPAIEAALGSPDADGGDRVELLGLLGEVGNAGNVPKVAAIARDEGASDAERKAALQALWRLPPHPAAPAAAEAVLDAPASPDRIRGVALVYLAERPSPRARSLAVQYRDAADARVRAGALYLGAYLGEPWAAADIGAFLEGGRLDSTAELLLRSLAETTSPEVLSERVPSQMQSTPSYQRAVTLARARTATGAERIHLCQELLESPTDLDRRDAIACLAKAGRTDLIEPLVQPGSDQAVAAAVRSELRRAGLRTVARGDRVAIEAGALP